MGPKVSEFETGFVAFHKLNKAMSQLNNTLAQINKSDINKQVETIYYAVNPVSAEIDRRRKAEFECCLRSHLQKDSYLSKLKGMDK